MQSPSRKFFQIFNLFFTCFTQFYDFKKKLLKKFFEKIGVGVGPYCESRTARLNIIDVCTQIYINHNGGPNYLTSNKRIMNRMKMIEFGERRWPNSIQNMRLLMFSTTMLVIKSQQNEEENENCAPQAFSICHYRP